MAEIGAFGYFLNAASTCPTEKEAHGEVGPP
jgi:hypothetical protein